MTNYNFSNLLKVLNTDENKDIFVPDIICKSNDFEIQGLTYDSRKVSKNFVFFAIKGYKDDGSGYIADAINRGALAVISDSDKSLIYKEICRKNNIWLIVIKNIRRFLALISSDFYGNPSRNLKMIGTTGTNGKTTISYLIRHILEHLNIKCGLIGTVDYFTGKEKKVASLTTPDSVDIQSMLNEMVENNCEYCVMEVSSIALVLDRVYGINYNAAVFSNLTSEHLDLHLNMENYFNAKKFYLIILILRQLRYLILMMNMEREYYHRLKQGKHIIHLRKI